MKELQIIIKNPDDGNPLNLEHGRAPEARRMTVGYKFPYGGSWYGDYISLEADTESATVLQAIKLLLGQSKLTEERLMEEGET